MRAEDVVNVLQQTLPGLVDDFTDTFTIASISSPSIKTIQIITSTAHGLEVGQQVFVTNVFMPIQVTSFTRSFVVGTIVTTQPHDLTKKGTNPASQINATIEGADQDEFNGSFAIQSVTDRNTFTVKMPDTGDTTATGADIVSPDIGSVVNKISGLVTITAVPSLTSFQYTPAIEITVTPVSDNGVVNTNPRISAAASLEQFKASYTKQAIAKAWLCVVVGSATANKSRDQSIDATDNIQRTCYFNQKYSTLVDLFVALPTTSNVSGRVQSDRCQELTQPIFQSILFKAFDSLLTAGEFNPLQFVGSNVESYDGAVYYHQYTFEQVAQVQFDDTVGFDDDVALRDIDLTQGFSTGVEELITTIDLDEE